MLEPLKHFLNERLIILASGSVRRKEIFERNLGLKVKIIPSRFPEDLDKSKFSKPSDYVIENSRQKALDVANMAKDEDWFLIIGADTVVELDSVIYEKPKDKQDAFEMLKKLNNKSHIVSTGVTLIKKNQAFKDFEFLSFAEMSNVTFGELDDETIQAYVDSGEPLDKAGSYGIQGLGSSIVKSIKGDFFNVEGFPAHRFSIELKKFIKS